MKRLLILLFLLLLPLKGYSTVYYVRGDADGGSTGLTDSIAVAWTWAEFVGKAATINDADIMYIRGRNPSDESTFTYTMTANLNWSAEDGGSTATYSLVGFWDTAGDTPTFAQKPRIAGGAYYFWNGYLWHHTFINWDFANATGLYTDAFQWFNDCDFTNLSATANWYCIQSNNDTMIYNCSFENTNGRAIKAGQYSIVYGCTFTDTDNAYYAISSNYSQWINNIFDTVTYALDFDLYNTACTHAVVIGNTFYKATNACDLYTGSFLTVLNNIFQECTEAITSSTANMQSVIIAGNALYDCDSSYTNLGNASVLNYDNDTANPGFTDAPNGDFSIDTTYKGSAYPSGNLFPNLTTSSFLDRGAVQREEAGGAAATTAHGGFGQ